MMTDMIVMKAVSDAIGGFDLDQAIQSFEDDPADTDFQEGFFQYLLCMKEKM